MLVTIMHVRQKSSVEDVVETGNDKALVPHMCN